MSDSESLRSQHYEILLEEGFALRPLQVQHAEAIAAAVNFDKPALARWLPWARGDTYGLDEARSFIEKVNEERKDGKTYGFGLFVEDVPAGHIALHLEGASRTDHGMPEIGYWISSEHAGRGLTTKATKRLIEFGFNECGLDEICLRADVDNIGSNRVAEKSGFVWVEEFYMEEEDSQFNLYKLTRDQFEKRNDT